MPKSQFHRLLASPTALRWRYKLRGYDKPGTLVYIHIGKCGGESLWTALQGSRHVAENFDLLRKVHVRQPPVLDRAKYLVVIRNPISRAISAYNWRLKLVLEDGIQKDRFPGERDVLARYPTLNALADALYDDEGRADPQAASDFRRIHHLKEDISFYLTDLLNRVSPDQIHAVLATEALDADMAATLGIENPPRVHENASTTSDERKRLDPGPRAKLRRFLAQDYAALEKLLSYRNTTSADQSKLKA